MYSLYILYSPSIDRFYTGISNDVPRRLARHNKGGQKYTTRGIPWVLKYTEEYPNRQEAQMRERFIKKKKSRLFIETLLQQAERNPCD